MLLSPCLLHSAYLSLNDIVLRVVKSSNCEQN